jgi:two-component system response regulator DesR
MAGSQLTRVLIADPYHPMAAAIAHVLELEPGIEVLAKATDRGATARLLARHRPDVLILDPAILGANGLGAVALLKEASPSTKVVLTGMDDAATWAHELKRSGVAAYVPKSSAAGVWGQAVSAASPRAA